MPHTYAEKFSLNVHNLRTTFPFLFAKIFITAILPEIKYFSIIKGERNVQR